MGKNKPGFMVYFELRDCLDKLNEEEISRLFYAMFDYAQYDEAPDFSDSDLLDMCWVSVKHHLDRDGQKYQKRILDGQYGAYKRACKESGQQPLEQAEWAKHFGIDYNE